MIKSKRTEHQATRFRSRLEARWAHFLTALAIPWEYEPELIDLGELRYLPDFRLPGYWLEIKGDMGDDQSGMTILSKCGKLAALTSLPVILAFYDPMAAKCAVFLPNGGMYQAHFGMCGVCGGLAVKSDGLPLSLCTHPNPPMALCDERHYRKLIFDAMVSARDCNQWSLSPEQ